MRAGQRFLRIFATLATFVVVWLVAGPARAAAPLCDPRGAIMFAPPPQMQDPEQSLDVVDPCDGRAPDPLAARHVVPTRGHGALDLSSSQEPATTASHAVPAAAPTGRVPVPAHALARPPTGVRSDVERPPRG